ncbi:ABC transporter ATP-binding protein [Leifsonia shinshuensis]|uniref:ABC-type glutathione transport system ATPase component n=1 Tax=Leifsonia shinshuensis TaxID=150026 RepID=A0A853CXC5_9MICO|nr:dipeptide/oligopeptide/nickel ABC transporter ATP-binding protein [Leifsonia shinshuensis]NYJ25766.1 ABC-type glutathione transport system ATPase component [Leifsonia shinshuensis]
MTVLPLRSRRPSEFVLEAHGVTVSYGSRRHHGPLALDGGELSLRAGESVAIVGESGSGKSTFAKALVGLVPCIGGELRLEGERLGQRRSREQVRRLQMVFQDPSSSLNPSMTVGRMLEELLRFHRMVPKARVRERARELLEMVGLPASTITALPRRLSGGQRQRVGIARALAVEPTVLIADESTAALDVSVQAAILNLLARLRAELGLTLLFISHDLSVVRHISDRVIVMKDGRIVEDRDTAGLFAAPGADYTRELLAAAPRL